MKATLTKKLHDESNTRRTSNRRAVLAALLLSTAAALAIVPIATAGDARATVGFVTGHGELEPDEHLTRAVELLREEYDVIEVALDEPGALNDVDVLVIAGAADTPDAELYELDQFLMRGGRAAFLVGAAVVPEDGTRPGISEANVLGFLGVYGVTVNPDLVLDEQCAESASWGAVATSIPYACWPLVEESGLSDSHAVVSGVSPLKFPWASSITLKRAKLGDARLEVLASSSSDSWTVPAYADIAPIPALVPPTAESEVLRRAGSSGFPLAVALEGVLTSAFAGQKIIVQDGSDVRFVDPVDIIETSEPLKLVVVSNAMMFRDDLAEQIPSAALFLRRIVDWLADDFEAREVAGGGDDNAPARRHWTPRSTGLVVLAALLLAILLLVGVLAAKRRRS